MNSKEIREKRADLAKIIRQMADKANAENREFNADEQANWDKLNADFDALDGPLTRAERLERLQAAEMPAEPRGGPRPAVRDDGPSDLTRTDAFRGWAMWRRSKAPAERFADAAQRCGVDLSSTEMEFRFRPHEQALLEFRALSVGTPTAGGYTVPTGFVPAIEFALLAFGGMRQSCDVFHTDQGNDLPWPTANDTGNTGVLVTENSTLAEQDTTFGQKVFKAYKYSSKLIKVSRELLEDSAVDLGTELGKMLGERIARITNTNFTTGTGASQPEGISVGAGLGKTAASNAAITADEMIDLFHSVDPAYRSSPKTRWMLNDATMAAIRKLKESGSGAYIWQPGLQLGIPDTIFGKPYTINQDVASIATVAKTIYFGDFAKYKIRDVAAMRLRRLEERFADADQVGFVLLSRHDGRLLDGGVKPIKYLQQAV